VTYPYKQTFRISDQVTVCFYDAGHILGSAMIELEVFEDNAVKKIIFSGDIGRQNKPILCDPTLFKEADIVFMESTYGDKIHQSEEVEAKKLAQIINHTIRVGGNIIIPTFAIERAQELLFFLSKLLREKIIPHIFVFVDSPMAINVTRVFKKYSQYFDNHTRLLMEKDHSPFDFPLLKLTQTVNESKSINHIKGSAIIMAGSGMCTGGRIKHHIITNITRSESSIVFVGYQAKGTLGREILEKPKVVRILGQRYKVKAQIENINGFSAHADKNDLFNWINSFSKKPEKIFLVHGEEEVINKFTLFLKKKKIKSQIIVPEYLSEFSL
ncbi:MAG: MBL fold metallo-hydrolase, partial [Candidatus Pacebacteria bacterium]|nr:MBL fold metallo-hydrolase [Candidatus Paceibacterota bacterium]